MRQLVRRTTSAGPPKAKRQAAPNSRRDRLAMLLALVTVLCLDLVFFLSKDTQFLQFLMPGPLTSAHSAIENCSGCHTKSGSGKLSWVHGLVAGDPFDDSKACVTCHKMPNTALYAHGVSPEVLDQSTQRLTKLAAKTPVQPSALAQSIAFPTDDKLAHGIYCATCHQEHQGANFKLNRISNEQCRSCHVVKFDSFDGNHPEFENYPFKRRTRIIYDHAGHFGKHFPEVAKKDPARRIPATCSTCHNSREDKRVMAVAPFEQTCTTCHLDQITGKERASGPKGIAFLALPGLDLQTLKKKKASIGEWPDDSEAGLTPFMKVMISRNEQGRALIKTVDSLNLQDLSGASNDQIKAVTNLVWEIKRLFYALIKEKASDVLADLNIGGATLSTNLVADLTASIPRDVVISAQRQWLPNLGTEMANRPVASNQNQSGSTTTEWSLAGSASPQEQPGSDADQAATKTIPQAGGSRAAQPKGGAAGKADTANAKPDAGKETPSAERSSSALTGSRLDGSESPEKQPGSDTRRATPSRRPEAVGSEAASKAKPSNPQSCIMYFFGQCLLSGPEDEAEGGNSDGATRQTDTTNPKPDGGKRSFAEEQPRGRQAGLKEAGQVAQLEGAAGKTKPANAKPEAGNKTLSADEPPRAKAADQTDDLLNPTEEELRGIAAPRKGTTKAAQPERAAPKTGTANVKRDSAVSADAASKAPANAPADAPATPDIAVARPQTRAAPVLSIESDVDPESWAEYGGWYRQDYAIFYRPIGHKDKFIFSWLVLTGPGSPKGDSSPVAAVFDLLTDKDTQGSCTKCHSVDDIRGRGRLVNFSAPSVKNKQGRFTNFIHGPHFGILENRGGVLENRGCLTCHNLEKGRPYLKSYEQGSPQDFVSNFGAVKKELCQTCHTSSMARQDCLLCHKYHVNGVITPIIDTRIPAE